MSQTFFLADSLALDDLQLYLSRAARVEDGSVRLIAGSGVLAVYVAVLYPVGLLDESPTVLGLRTFALVDGATFDAVVPIRSLLERLARLQGQERAADAPVEVGLPIQVHTATWAAISPPRGGWNALPPTGTELLERTARDGIDEVAQALPASMGEQIVHRVRSEVWGRGIPTLEYVPAGAAFAAFSLGFLGGTGDPSAVDPSAVVPSESVGIFETGPWTRLSTPRGHTLVRRRGWTLRR